MTVESGSAADEAGEPSARWKEVWESRDLPTTGPSMLSRLLTADGFDTPFGSFAVTVERKGQEVNLTTALKVSRHRINRSEYAAFRQFCLDVDAAAGQELVLVHE